MTQEEITPDTGELLISRDELAKRLDESRSTILSLEERLERITKTLGNVMELMKSACPEAYEEYMKKKTYMEEEN